MKFKISLLSRSWPWPLHQRSSCTLQSLGSWPLHIGSHKRYKRWSSCSPTTTWNLCRHGQSPILLQRNVRSYLSREDLPRPYKHQTAQHGSKGAPLHTLHWSWITQGDPRTICAHPRTFCSRSLPNPRRRPLWVFQTQDRVAYLFLPYRCSLEWERHQKRCLSGMQQSPLWKPCAGFALLVSTARFTFAPLPPLVDFSEQFWPPFWH